MSLENKKQLIIETIAKIMTEEEGYNNIQQEEDSNFLLCSDCFRDEGLKLIALKIGIVNEEKCLQCGSKNGHKLNKQLVWDLSYSFFVKGTIFKFEYGGAPLIQFNEHNFTKTNIDVSFWLKQDLKLLEKAGKIGFFYYGPRAWMYGEIVPLEALLNEEERDLIIEKIFRSYPVREVSEKHTSYRLRVNPKVPHDFAEYDSAPDAILGKNRFDYSGFPVLYASPDLELCIHECRTTVNDDLFVAKLVPTKTLRVLDLFVLLEEEGSEFESLDMAIHFLFLAGNHSYEICRKIATKAKEKGLDGIIYPSYFGHIRTGMLPFETVYGISVRRIPDFKEYAQSQNIPNLALFGRPIKENKLSISCINKVIINQVSYDVTFGPAYHKAFSQDSPDESIDM